MTQQIPPLILFFMCEANHEVKYIMITTHGRNILFEHSNIWCPY